jgi:molybdopterin molybdotransferase
MGTAFIGLPGNPVSALITILIIARPFLFDCQGIKNHDIVLQRQTALFDLQGCNRQVYLRVKSGQDGVELFSQQSSGALYATTWGDGIVVQYPGQDINHGDTVDVIPYTLLN